MKVISQLMLLLFMFPSKSYGEKVKVLNWWEYTPEHVVDDLKANGFDPKVITYRSNQTAISRLSHNKEKFEIAILSSSTIPILRQVGIIDEKSLIPLIRSRKYPSWLKKNNPCIPYFWGVTAFTYDSEGQKKPINSLPRLIEAEKNGYTIAILDDLFEFAVRFKLDYGKELQDYNNPILFEPRHFTSNLEAILKKRKVATYGWHGSSAAFFNGNTALKLSIGKENTVLGYDAVCILNGGDPKKKRKLIQFVSLFTSRQNTAKSIKTFQYFSPYLNQEKGLIPPVYALLEQVRSSMQSKTPIIIGVNKSIDHSKIIPAWRRIRYGQ